MPVQPSMVVTLRPSASFTGKRQELTAFPSIATVQLPHSPSPQPSFVPFSWNTSRNRWRRVQWGSTSTDTSSPLSTNDNSSLIPPSLPEPVRINHLVRAQDPIQGFHYGPAYKDLRHFPAVPRLAPYVVPGRAFGGRDPRRAGDCIVRYELAFEGSFSLPRPDGARRRCAYGYSYAPRTVTPLLQNGRVSRMPAQRCRACPCSAHLSCPR